MKTRRMAAEGICVTVFSSPETKQGAAPSLQFDYNAFVAQTPVSKSSTSCPGLTCRGAMRVHGPSRRRIHRERLTVHGARHDGSLSQRGGGHADHHRSRFVQPSPAERPRDLSQHASDAVQQWVEVRLRLPLHDCEGEGDEGEAEGARVRGEGERHAQETLPHRVAAQRGDAAGNRREERNQPLPAAPPQPRLAG